MRLLTRSGLRVVGEITDVDFSGGEGERNRIFVTFEGGVLDRCSKFSNGEIGAAVDHVNRELGPFVIESGEAGESLWNTGSALVGLGGFFGPSDDAV